MDRGQFTFYRSFWDAVKGLPKKDRLPILEAIISYALDGIDPDGLSQSQAAFFLLCRPTLDASRKKAANGKQGGSKPKANGKQTESEKEKEKEKEVEIENECYIEGLQQAASPSKRTVFTPPTLEEVKAYCRERGNNVDAQRWYDHYTSNGWLVGKNKMKDWKAAVRTWERSEYNSGASRSGNIFLDIAREEGIV